MYRHVPRFRYSKESLKIVESTSHAYIRALLHHREYSRLLEVLQEKVNEISSQYFYRLQTKLRECNIFTPVSHSVHRWGMCIPACNGGCLPLCPGGCTRPLADTPRADTPFPHWRRPLKRAVSILLECILVVKIVLTFRGWIKTRRHFSRFRQSVLHSE